MNHKKAGVALTFDDRFIQDWFQARTIFLKYGVKATFFISEFDKLTGKELEMLHTLKEDGHEIACHGLRHIHAVKFCEQHSIQKYIEEEIVPAIHIMTEKGFTPQSFSYPHGAHISVKRIFHFKRLFALEKLLDSELLNYFSVLRRVDFGSIRDPFRRKFYLLGPRPKYYYFFEEHQKICAGTGIDSKYRHTSQDLILGFQKALKYDCAIVLYGHRISQESGTYTTAPDLLEKICQFANANKMTFYCVHQLHKKLEA